MQLPKFAAMNNVAPKSTFDSADQDNGSRHVQQRSNTVMGVHDEHLLKRRRTRKRRRRRRRKGIKRGPRIKWMKTVRKIFLLDDEDIKEGMRDINATEEGPWSMSTNTKISLKPLGLDRHRR